ncbi:MAG: hypothetical protein ACHQQQ_13280 [Bacteroidota bacterium]
MKLRTLSAMLVLAILSLSIMNYGFAGEKNKSDAKADAKSCCTTATKASMTSKDCTDPSQCKMDKAECAKVMGTADCKMDQGKCPMKATKASLKTTNGKMDCCKGKASKASKASNSTKTKKTVTTGVAGTN